MSTDEPGPNLPVRLGFGRIGCELLGRNMPAERDVAFSSLNCAHILVDCTSEFDQYGDAGEEQRDLELLRVKGRARSQRSERPLKDQYASKLPRRIWSGSDSDDSLPRHTAHLPRCRVGFWSISFGKRFCSRSRGRTNSPAHLGVASLDPPREERVKPSTGRK